MNDRTISDARNAAEATVPASPEAELVLGCCLLAPDSVDAGKAQGVGAWFHDLRNALVWKAISDLHAKGVPPDAVTLAEQLKANGGAGPGGRAGAHRGADERSAVGGEPAVVSRFCWRRSIRCASAWKCAARWGVGGVRVGRNAGADRVEGGGSVRGVGGGTIETPGISIRKGCGRWWMTWRSITAAVCR